MPGSSGLKIFDDQHFYHRKAERLSNNNFDVILVDYKQYYKNSRDVSKPQKSTGEKIAWTVKEVLSEMDTLKLITKNSPGHIIGWSLAGEGVFHLIKDEYYLKEKNIKSVILLYPSNQDNMEIDPHVPLLVLAGKADNVINISDLSLRCLNKSNIKFMLFDESYHGFDIESLTKARSIRFPPVFGKRYNFQYNEESAKIAMMEIINWLDILR